MTYPKGAWHDAEAHLLFDIGYSYGLLMRAEEMLKDGATAVQVQALRDDLVSFREGRLNLRDEIYHAAHTWAQKEV